MSDNSPVPMPKRSHHAPLSKDTSLGDAFSHPQFLGRIKDATPKHLSPDRMLSVFIQSVQKTPLLAKCPVLSLLGAFVSVATVGLEPNTALGHAYLIPFNKKVKTKGENGRDIWTDGPPQVQVIFGYQGLLELTYRSGLMRSVHSDVVWKGDDFDFWYGSNGQLKHRPKGGTRPEGEMPTHAYMHSNLKDGGESYEVMPMSDVIAIRDGSQAYKGALIAKSYAGDSNKLPAGWTEAPWVKHFVPMARKTAFRAGSKWLPKSIELAGALALDELQDRKLANFAGVIEGSADVLDGGLDALPDEATNRMDVGLGGDYVPPQPEEARTTQVQVKTMDPARSTQQASVAKQPTVTGFEAYLIDDTGEVAGDVFTDPGVFAEAFLELAENTSDKAILIENNRAALLACKAFPNAAGLLVNMRDAIEGRGGKQEKEPETKTDPALVAAIPYTMPNGRGMDMWLKAARDVMPKLDRETMQDWMGNNVPIWQKWPPSKKMEAEQIASKRCSELGLKWGGTQPVPSHGTPQQEERDGPVQQNGDPGAQP